MSSYTIFALRLQNKKWFLETVPNEYTDIDLCKYCRLKYDFVRENSPCEICEHIQVFSTTEIDYYVKKYMKFYGIDNVRGGSYSKTTMSVDTIQHIQNELSTNFADIDMDYAILNKINDTYTDLHTWEKQRIVDEIYKITETYQKFSQERALLTQLRNPDNMVSRDVIHDIEWLCNRVVYYTNNTLLQPRTKGEDNTKPEIPATDVIRYKSVLSKLQMLYKIFFKFIDDGDDPAVCTKFEPKIYLMQPKMIFDTFFFHVDNTDRLKPHFDIADKIVNFYEYAYYRIMNRMDELEFDVNSYGYKFEDQFKFTILLLQQYL